MNDNAILIGLIFLSVLILVIFVLKQRGKPKPPLPEPVFVPIPRTIQNELAFHEIGHAICSWHCTNVTKVHGVFIHSNFTRGVSKDEITKRNTPRGELNYSWCRLVINLGGIAAELIYFGSFHSSTTVKDLTTAYEHAVTISNNSKQIKPPVPKHMYENRANLNFANVFNGLTEREAEILTLGLSIAKYIITKQMSACTTLSLQLAESRSIRHNELERVLHDPSWKKFETKYMFRA